MGISGVINCSTRAVSHHKYNIITTHHEFWHYHFHNFDDKIFTEWG